MSHLQRGRGHRVRRVKSVHACGSRTSCITRVVCLLHTRAQLMDLFLPVGSRHGINLGRMQMKCNARAPLAAGKVVRHPRSVSVRAAAVDAPVSAEVVDKCINTIRFLSIDAVNKANSGHPGAPMGCAPMSYVMWNEAMKYNPKNPSFINRDRFVLSIGHASMLQYSMLHLCGFDSVSVRARSSSFLHQKRHNYAFQAGLVSSDGAGCARSGRTRAWRLPGLRRVPRPSPGSRSGTQRRQIHAKRAQICCRWTPSRTSGSTAARRPATLRTL